MLWWTVLTNNGFPKCSWAHVIISITEGCQFFMQCRLRDQRSWAFNVGFRPCPLSSEISPDYLYLLMILWTVDGKIPKLFEIVRWQTLFLICWTILPHSCSLSGEPLPILACERLSLSLMLFLDTHVFLINPFTCGKFQTGFFLAFLNFTSLLLTLSQLFWNLLQALNSEWVNIYTKTINFINLNMKYVVFVLYSIEYRLEKTLQMITLCFI